MDSTQHGWNEHWSDYLTKLEETVKNYLGVKYVLPTSLGTGALHLCCLACGLKKGDEVILPEFGFIAAASAVTYTRARPVR